MRSLMIPVLMAGAVAACTSGGPRPYPTTPSKAVKEAVAGAPGNPRVISICYSSALNSPEEVLDEARYYCADGEVTFADQDVFWTPCGLLQPMRATYLCTPR